MPAWTRRDRPPAPLLALLAPGDRALASVRLADDGWAVVSREALTLGPGDADADPGADGATSRPWTDVDRGSVDPATGTLTVRWVDGTRTELRLVDSAASERWSRAFRERVQWSLVHWRTLALPGGAEARVALRRAADGRLFTQVLGDARVRLDEPAVLAAVVAAEDELRGSAGLAG